MCQFTNLIHWMVLHSPLSVTEHHHHNQLDLFPDFDRVLPFGTGTSIAYNHVDYQFRSDTTNTFQMRAAVAQTHLRGQLRAERPEPFSYHVVERDSRFIRESEGLFRKNAIFRRVVDKRTGQTVSEDLLMRNHSRVLYGEEHIPQNRIAPDPDQR